MQGKHVGGRFPRLAQVCARIDSGDYDQPEVIEQIIPALRRDIENPSLEQPGPAPLSIRPPTRQDRDPRATPNAGTTGREGAGFYRPGPLVEGGQGRDRDDVVASAMVVVYVVLAALAWLSVGGVAALFYW